MTLGATTPPPTVRHAAENLRDYLYALAAAGPFPRTLVDAVLAGTAELETLPIAAGPMQFARDCWERLPT